MFVTAWSDIIMRLCCIFQVQFGIFIKVQYSLKYYMTVHYVLLVFILNYWCTAKLAS